MPLPIRRPAKRTRRSIHDTHAFGVQGELRTHEDEKRALIHAHAHARAAARAGWGLGYYIGIAASCMVVVTGWWMTAGSRLSLDVGKDTLIQTVTEESRALKQNLAKQPADEEAIQAQIKLIQDQLEQAKKDAQQK